MCANNERKESESEPNFVLSERREWWGDKPLYAWLDRPHYY